ncbi:MAG: hypothetical protein KC416_03190 [Myxococcales bacterium]|nr:hypothetical protein [Myxococcales bacterium]
MKHLPLLRAITQARLHASTGAGVETIVTRLAGGELPGISNRFEKIRKDLAEGMPAEERLTKEVHWAEKRKERRLYGALVGALLAEGSGGGMRLHAVSEEIIVATASLAKKREERARAVARFASVVFVLPLLLPVLHFAQQRVQGWVTVPTLDPAVAFTLIGMAIVGLCVVMSSDA